MRKLKSLRSNMKELEYLESWKSFLNKTVRVIVNDYPDKFPKHKDGLLIGITETHLILQQHEQPVALLLADIRRIEVRNGNYGM